MLDGREEEGDQVERKSEILEKAYVKTTEEVTEVNQCKISETKAEMTR